MGQIETLAREVLDDIGTMGPARLFHYARVLLHGQVVFGMIGCLTMVYGTIHPGQVACALFGIVAVDLKHAPMMRSYAWLVTFLLLLDVIWHHFWAERLLRNYTGVKEENEMWWGLMVANTNKLCGRDGDGVRVPAVSERAHLVHALERELPLGERPGGRAGGHGERQQRPGAGRVRSVVQTKGRGGV